ncbi:DUF2834 domain-containing protein [Lysobacter sp. F60174L2]|uniref:DUF2834 domain-containing protein n=1 Tax=Lysobacter sp. F60174L2 TaxID=3459295 RepID=UPI00403D9814
MAEKACHGFASTTQVGLTQALGPAGGFVQVVYIILCIAGAALPLAQFVPWLSSHGLNLPLLVQQAVATPVSAFAWSDVIVSGVTVAVFVVAESRRLAMRHVWLPLLALLIGPSLALPLFLLLRERHLAGAGPNNSFKPKPLRSGKGMA